MPRAVRVSIPSVIHLLIQLLLNVAAGLEVRKVLAHTDGLGLHALGALMALVGAIVLGLAGLRSMLLAAAASSLYKTALGVMCAAIALVAAGFTVVFFFMMLSGASLLALGAGLLVFGAYAGIAGMLAVVCLFRSEKAFFSHSFVRTILTPSSDPWDNEEPIPQLQTHAPPPLPAPPPPAKPVPVACTLCPKPAASLETLAHTELLAASKIDATQYGDKHSEVRRCRTCKIVWWVDVHERWQKVDARVLADDPTASSEPYRVVASTAYHSSLKDAIERGRQFIKEKSFVDPLVALELAERPPWTTL